MVGNFQLHAVGEEEYRFGPPPGEGSCLVIFLHGYSYNGRSALKELVAGLPAMPKLGFPRRLSLPELIPGVVIRTLDAPIVLGNDANRSWFRVEDIFDADTFVKTEATKQRAAELAPLLYECIDEIKFEEQCPSNRVIVVGYSQGGTLAYYAVMSRRHDQLAGLYLMSPAAMDGLRPVSKTPIFLVNGQDDSSHYSGKGHARRVVPKLRGAGLTVHYQEVPGYEHDFLTLPGLQWIGEFADQVVFSPCSQFAQRLQIHHETGGRPSIFVPATV